MERGREMNSSVQMCTDGMSLILYATWNERAGIANLYNPIVHMHTGYEIVGLNNIICYSTNVGHRPQ